jgi:uncharacterized RDD family membrane protein YckC
METRSFSDQLNIATPEQVDLSFPIAGIGSRFVALLLDHLFQLAFYIVVIIVLTLLLSGSDHTSSASTPTGEKWLIAGVIFLNFCLIWAYFAGFEAFWNGQTPGKRIMKLRVIKDSGRQITFFESLTRNLLRFVDALPTLYLTGVITMACNRANKRLGDFAAGTIVVHERREEQPLLYVPTATFLPPQPVEFAPQTALPTHPGQMFPADALARLNSNDLVVIEAFLARALDVSVETRAALAERIARQLCAKMNVPMPEGNPERALESIAFALRGEARFTR